MKTLRLFIEREFLARVAKRGYWFFTVLGVLLMIALVFLPSLMNWLQNKTKTTLALSDPHQLVTAALQELQAKQASALDVKLVVVKPGELGSGSDADVEAYLKRVHAKAVAEVQGSTPMDASLVIKQEGTLDPSELASLENVVQAQIMQERIQSLDSASKEALSKPVPMQVQALSAQAKSDDEMIESKMLVYFMEILLMITLTLYGTWVAQGLIEEKSNRIVELLLVAAKPWQILFGKVIGVGLVALLQYAIWLGAVGVAMGMHPGGGIHISHVSTATLVGFPIFFVLGYLLYATLYGIGGSLVYRAEEQQMALAPVQLLMVVACYVGMAVLINPDSTFSVIVSLVPLCAPLAMFARIALTHVPLWQVGVSLALCCLFIWVAVKFGEKVYRSHALRTTGKSGWKLLFKGTAETATHSTR